jgi:hypothetical protein
MLVCSECRTENPEQAKFCTRCGRSLTDADSALRRLQRREDTGEGIDIAVPKPPNPLFAIVAIVLVTVAAVTVGAWWLLRPNPCEGKLASSRFPYCLEIPARWERAGATFNEQQADAYAPRTGDPFILVFAEQVEPGTDTSAYARSRREIMASNGLFPTPLEQIEVGGQEAFSWEVDTTAENGAPHHEFLVVLVRGEIGWAIHFAGTEPRYSQHRGVFDRVLRSWSFQ